MCAKSRLQRLIAVLITMASTVSVCAGGPHHREHLQLG